jgi:hypothetical protein
MPQRVADGIRARAYDPEKSFKDNAEHLERDIHEAMQREREEERRRYVPLYPDLEPTSDAFMYPTFRPW